MKNKIIILSSVFVLVFGVLGCGESSGSTSSVKNDSNTKAVVAVGVPATGVKVLSTLPAIPAIPEQ